MDGIINQIAEVILLGGFSTWLTIAVINNIIDRKTNIVLLSGMASMKLVKEDSLLGNGLQGRAVNNPGIAEHVLTGVIISQLIIVVLMWCGTSLHVYELAGGAGLAGVSGLSIAITGIVASIALWFFFLCGGLYFGYWIKTPQIQHTHLAVLIVSLQILTYVS